MKTASKLTAGADGADSIKLFLSITKDCMYFNIISDFQNKVSKRLKLLKIKY